MDKIVSLKPNQIFVFGSNLAGEHMGGAARQAKESFGAVEGIGEGLTGQCYAFPTLEDSTWGLGQRSRRDLEESRDKLYDYCEENPEKEFLMTAVGTGIAGYSPEYMKSLFTDPPKNLTLYY